MTLPPPSPYLPEQPESQASDAVRELYAQIRRLSGVPMVALIFRHLATLPDGLPWAWRVIGPPLAQGLLQERAWAMAGSLVIEPVVSVPTAAWRPLGIDAASREDLARLCLAYGRANPVNLLALRLMAWHLQPETSQPDTRQPPPAQTAQTTQTAGPERAWQAPEPVGPLLPMLDLHGAPPELMDLMLALSQRGQSPPQSAFVPSFYRQLASRPPLLALASLIVPPAFERIDAAAEQLRQQASAHAQELAGLWPAPPPCPPALREPMRSAIEVFSARIPEMIAVVALMHQALNLSGRAPGA